MRKRTFILLLGLTMAVIIAILFFDLSGKEWQRTGGGSPINLSGTWEVAAVQENGAVTLLDGEFMSFTEDRVAAYRDDYDLPYAESLFWLEGENLLFPDLEREYRWTQESENSIRLFESKNRSLLLIRYPRSDRGPVAWQRSSLLGKWRILFKGGVPASEVIEFQEEKMKYYLNGSKEPDENSGYSWKNREIHIDQWNQDFECHGFSETSLILLDIKSGVTWELVKLG